MHGPFIGADEGVVGERVMLSEGGFVSVTVVVDFDRRELVVPPHVESRGWLDERNLRDLEATITKLVDTAVDRALIDGVDNRSDVARRVRRAAGQFVADETGRRPMIVPIVIDAT